MISLLGSRSEGQVRLTSADPKASLDIRHSHLSEAADLEAIIDGVDLVADLLNSSPLADALELLPDSQPGWAGRDALGAWLRRHVGTMFHPSGTCQWRQRPMQSAWSITLAVCGGLPICESPMPRSFRRSRGRLSTSRSWLQQRNWPRRSRQANLENRSDSGVNARSAHQQLSSQRSANCDVTVSGRPRSPADKGGARQALSLLSPPFAAELPLSAMPEPPRAATALPTGTVTFLMSDIEGSTRLLQALGDGYGAVLDDHYQILDGACAGGGRLASFDRG